ncbi:MAG TPA: thioredoxin-disulfide reductase [Candidatus Limnocylindria bacterium]|nr:thioredoxin-disulfide reductase [Candidatus Limnocylindria bacterium]
METNNHRKLIIIGSGPAGLTAGIYASRANLAPFIFEGKQPGGQLTGTSYVENWPGQKSILGTELMMQMRDHAKHFGCTLVSQEIVKVDFSKRPFTLWTHKNQEFTADAIIIATGASPKKLGIPGEQEYWGKGVTTCAVCDGAFYRDKKVIIVGGGDTAMEDAHFMTKFTDDITIVHILDAFTASHAMQQHVVNNPKIKVVYNSTITTVQGNGSHVTSATITNHKTETSQEVPVDGIFIAVGLNPNTKPFEDQLDLTSYKYIKVHNHTRTSVEGVFVAGDVSDDRYRQAITSAGAGCMAALDAERFLAGH